MNPDKDADYCEFAKKNKENNSQNEEKEALRGIIRVLSDEELEKEKQFKELQQFLTEFPSNNIKLNNLVKKYLELAAEREAKELERKAKFLASLSSSPSGSVVSSATPKITSLEEKFARLTDAYEKMREYIEEKGVFVEAQENITPEQPTEPTSTDNNLYDDLFADLDQEEAERLRRKRAKDAAKKKLEEQEFARRQSNLSEKDRKLVEEAEKRQREKELEEQEAEAARKRQEERDKNIAEDRQELELTQKKELMEKELAEELEKINIADKEGRQRIEEKFRKRKLEIQKEVEEQKRKNDDELKEKEAAAIKENEANQAELDKIRKEIRLQEEQGRKAKESARLKEAELKGQKDRENQLKKYRAELYDAVLDYTFTSEEGKEGTRNPQKGYGTLRMFLDEHPNMEFNLHFGDIADINRTNATYRKAIEIFRKVAGNRFVTKQLLRELINANVQ
ncbi:4489_t:CDS:2, partial [Gigaspora margarita]